MFLKEIFSTSCSLSLLTHSISLCVCVYRPVVYNMYRHGRDGRKQWRDLLQQIRLSLHQSQILPWDGESAHTPAHNAHTVYVHRHIPVFHTDLRFGEWLCSDEFWHEGTSCWIGLSVCVCVMCSLCPYTHTLHRDYIRNTANQWLFTSYVEPQSHTEDIQSMNCFRFSFLCLSIGTKVYISLWFPVKVTGVWFLHT